MVVIGGGIVGVATATAILRARPKCSIVILEKEERPAAHQSGRNSGVIHTGIYYRPGSLKSRTVAAGRRSLLEFCERNGVEYRITGKVIVAVDQSELPRLEALRQRADQHGIRSELITRQRLTELEPYAEGIAALRLPDAGVVDFAEVTEALARRLADNHVELRTGWQVNGLDERDRCVVVQTDRGELEAQVVVNCAGLHSDRLANPPDHVAGRLRIVPFRGEYRRVVDDRSHLVRTMIYPVPDPSFPFLGVHFTRGIDGEVHAGPNAVLALAREGYSWGVVDVADTWELFRFPGFRRLVARHWRTGLGEMRRSISREAFVRALQRLVPAVRASDLLPAPAGVRAQAVDAQGSLVDDFVITESRRAVHVLNAPSPAATASLEIGRIVAKRAVAHI